MKKFICLFMVLLLLTACQNSESENNSRNINDDHESTQTSQKGNEHMKITMSVNEQEFVIALENNETTQALWQQLPLTMTMKDLNANEKYFYMNNHLPTDEKNIGHIEAGDVMLFGNNCLVVFYESFSTTYHYTRLGKIEDVDAFVQLARQKQDITVTFSQSDNKN